MIPRFPAIWWSAFLIGLSYSLAHPATAAAWIDIENTVDSAAPAAELLADKLTSKLRVEGSKTVFLNIVACAGIENADTPPPFVKISKEMQQQINEKSTRDADSWCKVFRTSLESALIAKGIRFLPESESKLIREKVAEEQLYQHASMNVDIQKAVDLGKQSSFQAFISVSVTPTGQKMTIAARSLRIKEAVYTISEQVPLQHKNELSKSKLISGSLATLAGFAGGLHYYKLAEEEKSQGGDYYKKYKNATTPETATAARGKVETSDKKVKSYNTWSNAGWGLAALGMIYLGLASRDELSYQIDQKSGVSGDQRAQNNAVELTPLVFQEGFGLGLSLDI